MSLLGYSGSNKHISLSFSSHLKCDVKIYAVFFLNVNESLAIPMSLVDILRRLSCSILAHSRTSGSQTAAKISEEILPGVGWGEAKPRNCAKQLFPARQVCKAL
jgi:hypothetical protein